MNPAQIGAFAYKAGITSRSDLQAAIAVAMAESGGNPDAVGDVSLQNATWGPSYGLWQIRSLKAESGKGTTRDGTRLKDPAFNAKSMYTISNGGKNWKPWSVWPLRAAAFMPAAAIAAQSVIVAGGIVEGADITSGAVGGVVDGATAGLNDIGTGVRATYNWVGNRNNWIRVAKTGIGVVIIGGAVFAIASKSDAGQVVIGLAKKAATKGAA